MAAYGADFSYDEVMRMVAQRLEYLADLSAAKAVELGKPHLAEHASAYRADLEWVRRCLG